MELRYILVALSKAEELPLADVMDWVVDAVKLIFRQLRS